MGKTCNPRMNHQRERERAKGSGGLQELVNWAGKGM